MFNQRWSPAQSIGTDKNVNVVPNGDESLIDAAPKDDDNCDVKGAVGLYEIELVGVKRRFQDLQEFCSAKRHTVAEGVELADELVKQVGESEAQAANNAAPVMQPEVETKIISRSSHLKKAREEAARGKAELNALRWPLWLLRSTMSL